MKMSHKDCTYRHWDGKWKASERCWPTHEAAAESACKRPGPHKDPEANRKQNRKTIRSCQRPITGCSHMRHWMRWWRIQRILTTMRCRRRQTSRCFEKSSKTGNHTLNCWHRIVKIPENLRHSQSSGIYQDTLHDRYLYQSGCKAVWYQRKNAHHISTLPGAALCWKAGRFLCQNGSQALLRRIYGICDISGCRQNAGSTDKSHKDSRTWSRAWQLSDRADKLLGNSVHHWRTLVKIHQSEL